MKKIVSLVLVSILCVSLFAGCGGENSKSAREIPEITSDGFFNISIDEFKKQFNETKVSGVEPLESYKIDPALTNEYYKGNLFDVQGNYRVGVVSEPNGIKLLEVHVLLLNKDERNSKEFKTYKKYIESMIRWANPKATSKDIKTYFEKLTIEDKNAKEVFYKDPITGFRFCYSVINEDLAFAIQPRE